jgi:hypothetical protein
MEKRITVIVYMLAIFLTLSGFGKYASAQSDSIMVESEMINGNDDYYAHKYQYLDMSLSDQTKILKFGLQPFKPGNYDFGVINIQAAYERKLNKSFSAVSEINSNLNMLDSAKIFSINFSIGARWYPFMKQRIMEGKSGNNCNGYYIGIKLDVLKSIAMRDLKQSYPYNRGVYLDNPGMELSAGLQQRLSNIFYIDANAFVNYSIQDGPTYGLMVLLGISFNVED